MADDTNQTTGVHGTARIAIVSDLHAYEPGASTVDAPSHLPISTPEGAAQKTPLVALLDHIAENRLSADLLVCCGDMTDRASPVAAQYVWKELHRVKESLGARKIIATTGNHDLDSRHSADFDAKGALQDLAPPFPFETEALNDQYWARNFVVLQIPPFRVVVLNSSAYHGQESAQSESVREFEHGRIADRTVERLRAALAASEPQPVNVLLCHHHPHRYSDIPDRDYSEMQGGENLLKLLSDDASRWTLIHGHKHYPRLSYGPGGSNAPLIFGAGSFSARLHSEQQARGRNQFYMLDFPHDEFSVLRLALAGSFDAWDWSALTGWSEAGRQSGLPASGGFGYRVEPKYIAQDIAEALGENDVARWDLVVKAKPIFKYITPEDADHLFKLLEAEHQIVVLRDDFGRIHEISKKSDV